MTFSQILAKKHQAPELFRNVQFCDKCKTACVRFDYADHNFYICPHCKRNFTCTT